VVEPVAGTVLGALGNVVGDLDLGEPFQLSAVDFEREVLGA